MFPSYDNTIKGYRLWDPTNQKVNVNWDINFSKKSMQGKEVKQTPNAVPIEVEMCEDENKNEDEE